MAAGGTERHQETLEGRWGNITDFFGAAADPRDVAKSERIQAFAAHRRAQGAKDSLRRELQDLRRGLTEAKSRGWVHEVPNFPTVRSTPGTLRKGRFHPPTVIKRWLTKLPADARGQATVAFLTGLRAEEIRRVEAAWVVGKELRMPAHATKERKACVIELDPVALRAIKARAKTVPAGALWPGQHTKAFRTARVAIKYTTPIELRDLRHTYGTLVARLIGMDAARDGLRHASLAMTQRYVSGDGARTAAGGAALGAFLEGKSGQRS